VNRLEKRFRGACAERGVNCITFQFCSPFRVETLTEGLKPGWPHRQYFSCDAAVTPDHAYTPEGNEQRLLEALVKRLDEIYTAGRA